MTTRGSKSSQQPAQDESILKLLEELKSDFNRRFDAQESRFEILSGQFKAVIQDNKELQLALAEKEKQVTALERKVNDQEQYQRSWSIRILNLPIPAGEDPTNNDTVMRLVFQKVLEPIFQGAIQNGLLPGMPSYTSILETAHILPTKPDQTPPIIVRFFSRNIKAMIFRLKKDFATKVRNPKSPAHPQLAFPFYEDLTTKNFLKMRAVALDKRVLACWSVAGQLRFRLHGESTIRRVRNIYDPVDTIITNSTAAGSAT